MRLDAPEWLILLPLFLAAAWYWPRLKLLTPWRLLLALTLILALAKPQWLTRTAGMDLWVLVDRSASAADTLAPRLTEWESLLERSRPSPDRIRFIDFAANAMMRGDVLGEQFSGDREASDLPLAIHTALANLESGRTARLLVLSDGYSTRSLGDMGTRLRLEEVALDYRLAAPDQAMDTWVERLEAPSRIRLGEPFLIEVRARATADGRVPYRLKRDDQVITEGTAEITEGRAVLRFTDRLPQPGAHRYSVELRPKEDALPGNNKRMTWIEVATGERLVLLTPYADDPVAAALRSQQLPVEVITQASNVDIGRLTGAGAVLINNLPAHQISADFLRALDFYVRQQGGGLMMFGGKHSFGSGGYFESAIDELLPISMELRMEHRKLATAMAIIMDRSGSMGMGVAGGMMKMDLANIGAARSLELLGPIDAITVLAVDSEPTVVVPLTTLGSDPGRLSGPIRRIAPGGGGIYVYSGLKAGWDQLKESTVGQRHVILFSDAADSEEPGDYVRLIEEMREGGTTISVIALGDPSDSDAGFLEDIAKRGGGRIFYNDSPADLPALFAQETVSVARSAFIEEPVPLQATADWLEVAARPLDWPATIDGYNLSYLRPEASAAAISGDEYGAPLVAFWQRGAGRTASVSFPVAGPFSQTIRAWPQYGDFLQTLSRWVLGDELPPGIGLQTRVDGTELILDLLYDREQEEAIAVAPPTLVTTDSLEEKGPPPVWQRMEPGRFRAVLPLAPNRPLRGAVQVGPHTFPFGPLVAGGNPEWDFDSARLEEIRSVANESGGDERLDLTTIWDAPRPAGYADLQAWLFGLALALVLLDAFWSRVGWGFGRLGNAIATLERKRSEPLEK